MYSPEITRKLERFANNDMRMARKEDGGIIITNTKQGNVNLTYWPIVREYRIADYSGKVLFHGKAEDCRKAIINLYDVQWS